MGWQVFLASVCFMQGGIIQGLIALNRPHYDFRPYHATLLTIAAIAFAIAFNTRLAARLPMIEGIVSILYVLGFSTIVIVLWTMAPRGNIYAVLFGFSNNGGWPTVGLSAVIGLTAPLTAYIGYDCSAHMAEEIQDASSVLPRAIIWSAIVNEVGAFVMAVTLIFTLGDVESVLNTETRQPFIQLFYNATRSTAGTTAMTAIVVVILSACCVSEVATASRQLWSFARDRGLPGSSWLSVVG